ncbi:uncharacterized protein si:ch211-170d8.2 [Girardinichthys multiradiatus]|uniref:uncharacterized protein si:ch211-170d8.2 n=1 Tax=Girardinichthys multiradiatus TaxID=208333 RepID=UPI001FACFA0C|nr:uncharacterized protein si:ch211-170d8.2 [Girardinichthys multiradiatus]
MAAPNYIWIASFVILLTSNAGVFGRAADSFGFLLQSLQTADGQSGQTLRTDGVRRWRRVKAAAHRGNCAALKAPWLENKQQAPEDGTTVLQLRVRTYSPGESLGLGFPGNYLSSFFRRVYRCCKKRVGCGRVKGIQGRLRRDGSVEFAIPRWILSMTVMRAELHLQLSNPRHLDINPTVPFMVKHNFPTRYRLVSRGDAVELKVDLLSLFQHLQKMAGAGGQGHSLVNMQLGWLFSNKDLTGGKTSSEILQDTNGTAWNDNRVIALEVGLVLGCSRAGSGVPCESGGVHLSHAPFMVIHYR